MAVYLDSGLDYLNTMFPTAASNPSGLEGLNTMFPTAASMPNDPVAQIQAQNNSTSNTGNIVNRRGYDSAGNLLPGWKLGLDGIPYNASLSGIHDPGGIYYDPDAGGSGNNNIFNGNSSIVEPPGMNGSNGPASSQPYINPNPVWGAPAYYRLPGEQQTGMFNNPYQTGSGGFYNPYHFGQIDYSYGSGYGGNQDLPWWMSPDMGQPWYQSFPYSGTQPTTSGGVGISGNNIFNAYTPTQQALLDQAGWSEFKEPSRPESGGGQKFTGGLPVAPTSGSEYETGPVYATAEDAMASDDYWAAYRKDHAKWRAENPNAGMFDYPGNLVLGIRSDAQQLQNMGFGADMMNTVDTATTPVNDPQMGSGLESLNIDPYGSGIDPNLGKFTDYGYDPNNPSGLPTGNSYTTADLQAAIDAGLIDSDRVEVLSPLEWDTKMAENAGLISGLEGLGELYPSAEGNPQIGLPTYPTGNNIFQNQITGSNQPVGIDTADDRFQPLSSTGNPQIENNVFQDQIIGSNQFSGLEGLGELYPAANQSDVLKQYTLDNDPIVADLVNKGLLSYDNIPVTQIHPDGMTVGNMTYPRTDENVNIFGDGGNQDAYLDNLKAAVDEFGDFQSRGHTLEDLENVPGLKDWYRIDKRNKDEHQAELEAAAAKSKADAEAYNKEQKRAAQAIEEAKAAEVAAKAAADAKAQKEAADKVKAETEAKLKAEEALKQEQIRQEEALRQERIRKAAEAAAAEKDRREREKYEAAQAAIAAKKAKEEAARIAEEKRLAELAEMVRQEELAAKKRREAEETAAAEAAAAAAAAAKAQLEAQLLAQQQANAAIQAQAQAAAQAAAAAAAQAAQEYDTGPVEPNIFTSAPEPSSFSNYNDNYSNYTNAYFGGGMW